MSKKINFEQLKKQLEEQTANPIDAEELNLELSGSSKHLSEEKE